MSHSKGSGGKVSVRRISADLPANRLRVFDGETNSDVIEDYLWGGARGEWSQQLNHLPTRVPARERVEEFESRIAAIRARGRYGKIDVKINHIYEPIAAGPDSEYCQIHVRGIDWKRERVKAFTVAVSPTPHSSMSPPPAGEWVTVPLSEFHGASAKWKSIGVLNLKKFRK